MSVANPYEVLRLDPAASEEEIVRQAGRLRQRETDEAQLARMRQAVQALTARPEERRLLALLTHPRPEYSTPALDRLAAAFRRPPTPAGSGAPCPGLAAEEFLRLLLYLAGEELEQPATPFEPVSSTEEADEISRQLAEAIWQSLVWDARA
jgi:hypothetical protein